MSQQESGVFETLPEELQETLAAWSNITINELKLSMAAKGMHLGRLYRSFHRKIELGADGMPRRVTIGFYYHGKFVDMGVGNGVKLENVKGNREIWRSKTRFERKQSKKPRAAKKWYSPTMYREYQRAAEILAQKYKIEIPARFEQLMSEEIKMKL